MVSSIRKLGAACVFSLSAAVSSPAQEASQHDLTPPSSDPVLPVPRDRDYEWMSLATWRAQHEDNCAVAARGEAQLVFIGDSITASTRHNKDWEKCFGGFGCANFGIGGDRTQNVLWRLENGEAGRLKPKLVVVLVGTNNIGTTADDAADTVRGVTAVVSKLRESFPMSRVLVQGLLPREERPESDVRRKVQLINQKLAGLSDGKTVYFVDLGSVFLEPNGLLSTTISPDHLHLSEEGIRRWAAALKPEVEKLMR